MNESSRQYKGQLDSMNVEMLNRKIAALEVQILDQEDTIEALNRWIGNKKAQCLKCKQKKLTNMYEKRKRDKEMENETVFGNNCQCEGEDCC